MLIKLSIWMFRQQNQPGKWDSVFLNVSAISEKSILILFWRKSDLSWIVIIIIQFINALGEVVMKKSTGSIKDSVFSMFSKGNNTDEYLSSVRATLIMALGCLSRRVDIK